MKKVIITLLLCMTNYALCIAQIGTWKAYMAYHDIQQIQAAGDELFVMASNDLYQYNKKDQSIVTYDKVNGLNDTYITQIRWCQQAKRLVIIYNNSNIDLLQTNGNVTNISDIYTKAITGDKTVNSIYIYNQYAYLACGFGIVKVNVKDAEISESYILGFSVTAVTISGNNIYAQSKNKGTWMASLSDNLINKGNWKITTDTPSFSQDTDDYDNNIDLVKTLKPGGPKSNNNLFLLFKNKKLYTCGKIIGGNFDPNIPGTILSWDGNDWTYFQDQLDTITKHSYCDLTTLDVDPTDPTHLFAGGRTGLYEFRNGMFIKEYNYHNSVLKTTAAIGQDSKDYTFVQTVVFDNNGHLWLFNSGSNKGSLYEITKDGEWISHHKKEFFNTSNRTYDNIVNAMFDSRGILWCCNDRFVEPALICYQQSTDEAIVYKGFINQDGTSLENVYGVSCVAEDLDGNIWVGTNRGLLMIEKENIGKNANEMVFTQVKVPRNDGTNYADYLLAGLNITCIKVDNDGNKWVGTNGNGVYQISRDNMTELNHFTTENSYLLSDVVGGIDINDNTGEVFIGTNNGLCSYMGGVTKKVTEMTEDNVYAYPNPVKPDYSGPITITGLTYNADVKILSASGVLIAEGKSNGQLFTWDGCDKNGNRVASGVYMVAIATNTGEKGVVCKIAIIR